MQVISPQCFPKPPHWKRFKDFLETDTDSVSCSGWDSKLWLGSILWYYLYP